MLDPDDRDAGLPDLADCDNELVALAFGQPSGDFIEQEQPRTGGERARHFEAFAFQQRQRARECIGALQQAKPFENLAAGLGRLALG